MFKLTYVLFRFGHPDYIPLPVTGSNGYNYGHALFDPKTRAHVFRFTKEQWEGDGRNGACEHMLKRNNRSAGVWSVFAEVEFDAESAAGQLASQVDALQSELEAMRAERDALATDYATLTSMAGTPRTDEQIPEGKINLQADAQLGIELLNLHRKARNLEFAVSVRDASDKVAPAATAEVPTPEGPPENPGTEIPLNVRLAKLTFQKLGDEMTEQIAAGATFDLDVLNTKTKRAAALLEWYKNPPVVA